MAKSPHCKGTVFVVLEKKKGWGWVGFWGGRGLLVNDDDNLG